MLFPVDIPNDVSLPATPTTDEQYGCVRVYVRWI
jgi:hypothetical protein